MTFGTRFALIAGIMAATIPTGAAQAPNIGGIIDLMGRAIEHDMRLQRERQLQEEQERYHREQQRQIERERLAQVEAQREREIQLIKRLQTALGRLGYYRLKVDGDRGPATLKAEALFGQAFNMRIQLDEETIAWIESVAERGFRSASELQAATGAGFRERESFLEAMKGGFENARDFENARRQGFATFEEYRNFNLSDFRDPEEYRAAIKGGFSKRAEFQAAMNAGFSDRQSYMEFRKSGFPDKESYDAELARRARVDAAAAKCESSAAGEDPVAAIDLCIDAIALGAEPRAALSRLEKRAGQTWQDNLAAADGTAQPDASGLASRHAALQAARQRLQCGAAIVHGDWENAERDCALALQAGRTESIVKLSERARNGAAAAQAAALAEQRRLALQVAHQRMSALLEDISEYTESNRSFDQAIEIARAVVRLKQLDRSEDVAAIEHQLLNVEELLAKEDRFRKFKEDNVKAAQIAQINARTVAIAEIRRAESFIGHFVGRNVLHDAVDDLLALQEELASARESGQDQRLFHAQKLILSEMARLRLSEPFDTFIYEEQTEPSEAVAQAENGLAITEDNQALLDGHLKDVLVLGNFTPTAPHLIINLLGAATLDENVADYCWIGPDHANPPLFEHVAPVLRELGAASLTPGGECTAGKMFDLDILILERGTLLAHDLLEVRPLIEAFEAKELRLIRTIAWSEVGDDFEQRRLLSERIRQEVTDGVRLGFGWVRTVSSADTLCWVVPEDEQAVHANLHDLHRHDLERDVPSGQSPVRLSLDRAFVGLQKNSCSVVYAEAPDLARLFEASRGLMLPLEAVPLWIAPEQVAQAREAVMLSEQERRAQNAALHQEMEADAAQARQRSEEAAVLRQRRQQELREQYGQEARAAHNELASTRKAYINGDPERGKLFRSLFPEFTRWYDEEAGQGWELDEQQDELLDYGTAEWRGRRLEAVLIRTELALKNAVRGEYARKCFDFAWLIDSEFEMRRDPVIEDCTQSSAVLVEWKNGRAFESRWRME